MMYYKVILWIDVNCIESKTLQEWCKIEDLHGEYKQIVT